MNWISFFLGACVLFVFGFVWFIFKPPKDEPQIDYPDFNRKLIGFWQGTAEHQDMEMVAYREIIIALKRIAEAMESQERRKVPPESEI